jgi:non-ribosomal peptide synthetase component E (peptide arylation enzyme)
MTIDAFPRRTLGSIPSALPTLDHFLLGGAAGDVALVDGDDTLTYAELEAAVTARAAELDAPGPLLLEMANDLPSVVTYLAALSRDDWSKR